MFKAKKKEDTKTRRPTIHKKRQRITKVHQNNWHGKLWNDKVEQNSKQRQGISQCKSREKMEQRTRPCTLPCKVRGSAVISAETRMNLYANLDIKAHLTTVSCYQGEIPSFYCTHYLLLQGVEEQPAIRKNWSSQARIFCRYLGTNSGLSSLLACHLLLSICQHPF